MSEGPMDETRRGETAPEPISYRFAWTPALCAEITGRRPPPALGLTGSRAALAGVVVACMALISAFAIGPALVGVYPRGDAIVALWGAAGGLLGVLLILIPYMRRKRIEADLATRLRQGKVRVTLSAEGVAMASDLSHGLTRWPGVALVSETPTALLLWLGAAMAAPVPDGALPQGVDRAEALRRIAAWREAAA